jgi:hypothetical protein
MAIKTHPTPNSNCGPLVKKDAPGGIRKLNASLLLERPVILAIAAGIPARMCHRFGRNFLVMSTDSVGTATRFLRTKRIKTAVGHREILACAKAG